MTLTDIMPQARANRAGELCPTWCATDHNESYAVTPSGRELFIDAHCSAAMGSWPGPQVRLVLHTMETPVHVTVSVPGQPRLMLDADQAEALAALLPVLAGGDALLADELRTAAAIAREGAE